MSEHVVKQTGAKPVERAADRLGETIESMKSEEEELIHRLYGPRTAASLPLRPKMASEYGINLPSPTLLGFDAAQAQTPQMQLVKLYDVDLCWSTVFHVAFKFMVAIAVINLIPALFILAIMTSGGN